MPDALAEVPRIVDPRFADRIAALVGELVADLDGGTLTIYGGERPAAGGDPGDCPKLAELRLPTPAFGPAVDGIARLTAALESKALATGCASWWLLSTADGRPVFVGSVGERGGLLVNAEELTPSHTIQIAAGAFGLGVFGRGEA